MKKKEKIEWSKHIIENYIISMIRKCSWHWISLFSHPIPSALRARVNRLCTMEIVNTHNTQLAPLLLQCLFIHSQKESTSKSSIFIIILNRQCVKRIRMWFYVFFPSPFTPPPPFCYFYSFVPSMFFFILFTLPKKKLFLVCRTGSRIECFSNRFTSKAHVFIPS